jgi:hypothetical protein
MYRVIILKSNGILSTQIYGSLQLAYQACLPEDKAGWHIMLYNAVADRFANNNSLVSVSHDYGAYHIYEARWIEFIADAGIFTGFPALMMPQAFERCG